MKISALEAIKYVLNTAGLLLIILFVVLILRGI